MKKKPKPKKIKLKSPLPGQMGIPGIGEDIPKPEKKKEEDKDA